MDDREQELCEWVQGKLGPAGEGGEWATVSGDASSRRYFRWRSAKGSWIGVDSPPQTENNTAFLDRRVLLERAGLPVPRLYGQDVGRGFMLVSDLGDVTMGQRLDREGAKVFYPRAMELLLRLQQVDLLGSGVPAYSEAVLREELERFPEWFCSGLLKLELDASDNKLLDEYFSRLLRSAAEQPQALVHRDYHSRNLMVQEDDSLALIDFQDAVKGPVTYDLVSLLRDCYVHWPQGSVETWLRYYWKRLPDTLQGEGTDLSTFRRWFDLMGLQRHTKVLGNFARLALRDGKPVYLKDIPRVLKHIDDALKMHRDFLPVRDWFRERLRPAISRQPWSRQA